MSFDDAIITMIKFSRKIGFPFCSAQTDPYFILGVERSASFPQIKKAFYRLAGEFHPDRNSSQAQKKFVVIKQAFESIKMEKGLMKPQNLYPSEQRESMRPNPEKYAADEEEGARSTRDYTVFGEKAAGREEYASFGGSFKTINDINSVKIKVEEGEMADPTSRFGLQKHRARISRYSQGGMKYFYVIMTGLVLFTVLVNQSFSEEEVEAKEGALKKLTEVQRRKTIVADLVENRRVDLANLKGSKEVAEFRAEENVREMKAGRAVRLVEDTVLRPSRLASV